MTECLREVDVGDFVVKVNHRGILDGLFEHCGVPADLFRPICRYVGVVMVVVVVGVVGVVLF